LNVDPQTIKDIQENRPVTRMEGTIRSPIAGIVVEKLITPGQLVEAGTTPCFTVADLSRVWVQAQIFGPDVAAVHIGDTADVESDLAATHLQGTVTNVSALVDPDTRSVIARVLVPNTAQLLKKQMYVRVLIRSQHEESGVLIPVSAVLRDDENLPFVYLEQSDGSFARRHVTLGYRDADRYEIPSGLKAGEKLVVAGGIFVRFIQSQ
jgi:cobalt-zinc-cadmium efflux system membrane fusion protein